MSDINFPLSENGYDVEQVNNYISLLQQEYENAVAWGEDMESKLAELEESTRRYGLYFTIDEGNQSDVIAKVFHELKSTVERIISDAESRAERIIEEANHTASGIRRQAMENSVEIRRENTTIMNNLKAISDMIAVVLDKNIQ